jgi:hypothetical protein
MIPGLAFAAPWALAAMAVLPGLWWLLRVTPPAPLRVRFPAIRLLMGLEGDENAAAHTPPWVLLLRLCLAAALILAAAGPLLNPGRPLAVGRGPLVIAIDDGWASARDWPERRAALNGELSRAERAARPVILLPTAPPADGGPVVATRMMAAAEARANIQALEPKPWPTDRRAAAEAVKALPRDAVSTALWLADGLDEDGAGLSFARSLQSLGGGLEVLLGHSGRMLLPPAEDSPPDRLLATVRRLPVDDPERLAVRGIDGAGKVLAREEATLGPGQAEATVSIRLPVELRNRLVRLDIEGEAGSGSVVLMDERWRRRPVGLAGGNGAQAGAPLLDRLYYVQRALSPYADLHQGEVAELLARPDLAVLMLADVPVLLGNTADRLLDWIHGGGVMVRFAGPLLAHAVAGGGNSSESGDDPFLPVHLRDGGRSLGGAMSWTAPMALAPFAESSPFAGLRVPEDVRVNAQVLAEPSLDLASRTWAQLADGTPLVTAQRSGKGWVVLIHTSSNADWSNLALSGLFVDMLRRLVALSEGVSTAPAGSLAPVDLLDGSGHLSPPNGAAAPITEGLAQARPGPRHPPGFYGQSGSRFAFNLSPRLASPKPLVPPPGVIVSGFGGATREIALAPALLVVALLLAVADLLVSLALRGLLWRPKKMGKGVIGSAVVLALLAAAPTAEAADSFALEAGLSTRLAYVRSGDDALDRKSMAGLKGLSAVIAERSTAVLAEPMGVDIDKDPVLFFPLLYWPVSPAQKQPTAAAIEKLNTYMSHGGLIVFDTGDEGQPGAGADTAELTRLRGLVQGLALPPLEPVTTDHVLTRSFYLLKEMPGRYDGNTVWIEQGGGKGGGPTNDGVSPVILGGNDWAGAWAVDGSGKPLYAVQPGGERQRELAYRFGVNLVMYALTGNYKSDQVHLPAIMERLGR